MRDLTRREAEEIAEEFLRDYPVAWNELVFVFRKSASELYGELTGETLVGAKGGYLSNDIFHPVRKFRHRGSVHVYLETHKNRADFLATLRHELLGHFGINSFTTTEKSALLHSIIESRNEQGLKQFWSHIQKEYSDKSVDVQAEEVFARVFEHIQINRLLKFVSAHGPDAFRETCIDRTRPMQWDDLLHIGIMVAQGIHDGSRTQQHFPQDYDLVFADRINNIPYLRNSDGATYTFWQHASEAISHAGEPGKVDWRNVEGMTIIESIGSQGQKPADVASRLCEISPGAVTIKQQLELRGKISVLSPQLEAQYARKRKPPNERGLER